MLMDGAGAPMQLPTEDDKAAMEKRGRQTGAAVARYGVPLAAVAAFPPTGVLGFLGAGSGFAGGELAARGIEGNSTADREAMAAAGKAFIQGGTPINQIAPAASLFGMGRMGWGLPSVIGQATKTGLTMGATEGTSEIVKRSIEQAKLAGYDGLLDMAKQTAPSLAMGVVTGGLASKMGGVAAQKVNDDAAKEMLQRVGIENTTLGMVRPQWAAAEARYADGDRRLWDDLAAAEDSMVNYAKRVIGKSATNPEITAQLAPLSQKVDQLAVVRDTAEKEAQTAMQALQEAEQKLGTAITPQQIAGIRAEQQALALNLVTKKAAVDTEAAAALGDLVNPTDMARMMGKRINELAATRSAINDAQYSNVFELASQLSGREFNAGTGILPKEAALKAATNALRGMGQKHTTSDGKQILQAVADMEAQKVILKDADGVPIVDRDGNPMVEEVFNKAQVDGLQNYLAGKFASASQGNMSLNQAEHAAVSGAVAESFMNRLEQMFPEGQVNKALLQANSFNRITAQIKDSPIGRALLQKTSDNDVQKVADGVIKSVANSMINGEVDEIKNFKEFVGALGNYNAPISVGGKEISTAILADQAMETMGKAVGNAYRLKHTTDAGTNYAGLFDDVLNAYKRGGEKMPLPVEKLGYGSIQQVRDWRDVSRSFKPGDMSDNVVASMMDNPNVQKAIATGALDTKKVLRTEAAGLIFNNYVDRQVKAAAAGLTADAKRAASAASDLALQHNISAADAQRAYEAAKNDPITGAFAGTGNYKWTDETNAAAGAPGTVSHFLFNQPPATRSKIMGALEKNNPQLYEVVERRVMTDAFEKMLGPSPVAKSGSALNFGEIRRFQNPFNEQRSAMLELRQTLGPETAGKFESLVKELDNVGEMLSHGRTPNSTNDRRIGTVLGMASLPASGLTARPGSARAITDYVMDLYLKQRYNTLSAMIQDKGFATNVIRYGLPGAMLGGTGASIRRDSAGMADALSSLPVQKAALFLSDRPLMSELGEIDRERQAKAKR